MKLVLISLLLLSVLVSGCISNYNEAMMYEIYPDTEEAPVLELFWDDLDLNEVTRYTPYGVWEGWMEYDEGIAYEPANEMQFYTTSGRTPIRTGAPGTVILVERESGFMTIRYGRNYSMTYHHLIDILDFEHGDNIEAGDIIGYGEMRPVMHDPSVIETWWEIELNVRRGDRVMTVPPYDYFSEKSRKQLDDIILASKEKPRGVSIDSWTVTDGCSWIKYFPSPEWISTSTRLGFNDGKHIKELEMEFLRENNLNWTVKENGRVIGPVDDCNN